MKNSRNLSLLHDAQSTGNVGADDKMHVLIIDDDATLGFLARQVLEKHHYIVHVATDAEQALKSLNSFNISCILLDLTMPEVNGFELCQLIKYSSRWSDIPVIVVSGQFDNATVDHAFSLGVFDFVRKPVNWQIMTNRIVNILKYFEQQSMLRRNEELLTDFI